MSKEPNGAKSAGTAIVAALFVTCAIIFVFLTSQRDNNRDGIVLPENPLSELPTTEENIEPEALFVFVEPENVKAVLETMTRPAAYYQKISIETFWNGGSGVKQVEIWRSGQVYKAVITDQSTTRNVLTNGESVWIWYDRDNQAVEVQAHENITTDDLLGIPTYETVLDLDVKNIVEAQLVTPEDLGSCLYVEVQQSGQLERYWIDSDTQLLVRSETVLEGEITYALGQLELELLSVQDEQFRDIFMTPDGMVVTE